MRVHTNGFKTEITKFGREIDSRLYHYLNFGLATESNDLLLTEDSLELITEQTDEATKELINNELIYSIDIIKNGQLLQSLMKECNFEAEVEFRVGDMINPQLGVLVNGAYEYLDYGNYIIYSKEYIAENKTWRYVCYDKMLYSMIQYKPLDITYPCTIRDYLIALASRIGLPFANSSDNFTNYNAQVLDELFEGQSITYRDILDKLSEITASNILINDNDELELGYPNETGDTIDEENLKDVNVNFAEAFGPINKVSIQETNGEYEYASQDDSSINQNGLTQINIVDNIFAFNGNSETIAQNILNKIKGLTYSICDFTTTGVCYYDFLDLFNVSADNTNYKCLLLNNEINISQGISEQIFNQKLKNSEKESDNFKTSVMNNKEVSFQINKQKGEIQSKVEKDGVISAINQSAEQITIDANKIKLEGYTTINNGFSVDLDGNMTARGGTFTDGNINLFDNGNYNTGQIVVKNNDDNMSNKIFSGGWGVQNNSYTNNKNSCNVGYTQSQLGNRKYIVLSLSNIYNNDLATRQYCNISPLAIDYYDDNGNFTEIKASGIITPTLTQTSKAELKKNFEKLENAIDIIKQTDIYKYNLKSEDDKTKKHIGLVIGDKYNYSKEITSNDNESVDIYSFISVCCKAIQEQQKQIETLQKQVQDLERKIK